jgi:hypothetical protein
MGYCPHICVICKTIQDNGWGHDHEIQGKLEALNLVNKVYPGNHCVALDLVQDQNLGQNICDKCWRKGPSVRDPFFAIKRTKQARTDYYKTKGVKY